MTQTGLGVASYQVMLPWLSKNDTAQRKARASSKKKDTDILSEKVKNMDNNQGEQALRTKLTANKSGLLYAGCPDSFRKPRSISRGLGYASTPRSPWLFQE